MNEIQIDLDELADKISEKLHGKQEKQFQKKQSHLFHNTRLLLKNYHQLKAHTATVKEGIEESKRTPWNDERLDLNSLWQNKAKTVKLMRHVDDSLDAYKKLCAQTKSRGYYLIYLKFIEAGGMTDENLGREYHVSRQAISKQLKSAIDELSVILYGADGVKFK